jgi:hypothetical protein
LFLGGIFLGTFSYGSTQAEKEWLRVKKLPFSLNKPVDGMWGSMFPQKKLYPSFLIMHRLLYGAEGKEESRDDMSLYARMQESIKEMSGKKRRLPPAVFPWSGGVYATLLPQNGGGKEFVSCFADSFKNMWARQLYRHRVGGILLMMIGAWDPFSLVDK